jgi:molecular chaperone GrpE
MTGEELKNNDTPESSGTEDAGDLEKALVAEKEKAEQYLANWQRAQADFINYKRRVEQEREERSKFANLELILNLLPVLDDFERAFSTIPEEYCQAGWVEGARLVERKLRSVLEAQGVSPIEAMGEPFDPSLHEAVRQACGEDGVVVGEVEKGYKLHDKVIRPTKVVVGNGDIPEEE